MAVTDYKTDPNQNVAISGISIAEQCNASNINNAIRQLMADLATLVQNGGVHQSGELAWFGRLTPPAGWFVCDGSAVSRTAWPALFAVISTNWGAGDGSTTFNLPDMRGRGLIGSGQGAGLTNRVFATSGGEETHVLSASEAPVTPLVVASGVGATAETAATAAGHNNMQPYTVGLVCIKT